MWGEKLFQGRDWINLCETEVRKIILFSLSVVVRQEPGGRWLNLSKHACPGSEKKSLTKSRTLFLNKRQQLEEPSAVITFCCRLPPAMVNFTARQIWYFCPTSKGRQSGGHLCDLCELRKRWPVSRAPEAPRSTRSSLCKQPSKLRFHSQSSSGIKRAGRKSSITCLLSGTSKYIHSFAEWQFPTSG